jgi:hypothetical protein
VAINRKQGSWSKFHKDKGRGLMHGYRSGLEKENGDYLTAVGEPPSFETLKIQYCMPAVLHTYSPDFPLKNGIIVETKGKFERYDRLKHLLIRMEHPELDIRFVFQKPHAPLDKGAKLTNAGWCEKHGFKWAARIIPEAWVREPDRPYVTSAWWTRVGTIPIPQAALDKIADTARQPHKAGRIKTG